MWFPSTSNPRGSTWTEDPQQSLPQWCLLQFLITLQTLLQWKSFVPDSRQSTLVKEELHLHAILTLTGGVSSLSYLLWYLFCALWARAIVALSCTMMHATVKGFPTSIRASCYRIFASFPSLWKKRKGNFSTGAESNCIRQKGAVTTLPWVTFPLTTVLLAPKYSGKITRGIGETNLSHVRLQE